MKGSGRQASREPDHKHPAWETNEKNWETNERKWETSRPGTRPDHPAPRRPFFKALRTPNSKLFGEVKRSDRHGRQMNRNSGNGHKDRWETNERNVGDKRADSQQ